MHRAALIGMGVVLLVLTIARRHRRARFVIARVRPAVGSGT